jgi:ribosome-interacting GTPase 1
VNITAIPFLLVVNKDDDIKNDEDFAVLRELLSDEWKIIPVSAKTGKNIVKLEKEIIAELNLIRVYSKPPGKSPDLGQPFVLKAGSNIEDFARFVHKDFSEKLKTARIWGKGVYDGQQVSKDHILADGDIVELHI